MKYLNGVEKEAKMAAMKKMRESAMGELGKKLHGMKKVTVMSPDKEGLEEGLEKAKEIVEQSPMEMEESSESPEMEASEELEEESSDLESMSEEELDTKIQELIKLREMMKAKK